jgi:hypothetical protein
MVDLASAMTFRAATHIARFPTSNAFRDWDTALHTFTFANAVEQGPWRSPSKTLLQGVFDAAASVHVDRFLNVPAKRMPHGRSVDDPVALLQELPRLLDRQQQVDPAGQVGRVIPGGGRRARAACGGARRCPAPRESRLPHHPMHGGGRAPA